MISPAPSQPSNSHYRWPPAQSVQGFCSPFFTSSLYLLGAGETLQWARERFHGSIGSLPFHFAHYRLPTSHYCHSPNTPTIANPHSIALPGLSPHSHSLPLLSADPLRTPNFPHPGPGYLPSLGVLTTLCILLSQDFPCSIVFTCCVLPAPRPYTPAGSQEQIAWL